MTKATSSQAMDDPYTRYGATADRGSLIFSQNPNRELPYDLRMRLVYNVQSCVNLFTLLQWRCSYLVFTSFACELISVITLNLGADAAKFVVYTSQAISLIYNETLASFYIRAYVCSVARPPFPGYLSSEAPSLLAHHIDLPGAYAVDDILGNGVHPEPSLRITRGASIQGHPSSLEDPSLFNQRQDISVGISPSVRAGRSSERPGYLGKDDGFTDLKGESNVLFVDGLPTDCTRREVGHLFRPFIGFREIKVVHKGPRHSGDKAMVLCFVEFVDEKCALTAMEALQGYKFDNKKPDSPVLRIQFAHFPFTPSYCDDEPNGISR
ncbi:hypothetical protein FNV43_RR11250 [Rhamnella rubrinervis]|uniref:RRM domain-containing protein n=1 Tax=Rhamnella rubrinervis TaxID=2594499 RepID=A0A8K0H572_9ROSA|nr:hypothetical protein FNV43_RR11250 [Rhamnella rubrinervis]